jgi:protein TonB
MNASAMPSKPTAASALGSLSVDDDEGATGSRRAVGLAVVIGVHLLIGFALASGLGKQAIELIKKPLEATIVEEVKLPPPPPPPPPPEPPKQIVKAETPPPVTPPPFVPPPEVAPPVSAAPVIESVSTTPPAEPVPIAPPAPQAPPVQVVASAPAGPRKLDIGVACPTQVKPEMPAKALRDGATGTVKASARIQGGKVVEVSILSGPKIFHESVRQAMLQYQCAASDAEVTAVQEFKFAVE